MLTVTNLLRLALRLFDTTNSIVVYSSLGVQETVIVLSTRVTDMSGGNSGPNKRESNSSYLSQ